jgi:hypothetical protein
MRLHGRQLSEHILMGGIGLRILQQAEHDQVSHSSTIKTRE